MKPTGHPFERILAVLLPAILAAHVVGALVAPELLWGANFYAFFPPWVLAIAVAALATFLAMTLRAPATFEKHLGALPDPDLWSPGQRVAAGVAASAAAGAIAWTLRIRHTLLGDGNAILLTLPRGDHFHPRQPLTVAWTAELYAAVRGWGSANQTPDVAAQTAVALASVIAGMLFVPVAWGLAQELVRTPPGGPERAHAGPRTAAVVWLTAGILLTQGYMQLFFGYVENYTTYLLALGVFVWLALRHLDGRAPLAAPLLTAFVALGLHLSGGVLFPALGYLVFVALRRPERRRAAWRDLGIAALAGLGLILGLSRLGGGYDLFAAFAQVFREAVVRGGVDTGYGLSLQHVRDFLDEQLLIGPFGLFLFLPAVGFAARSRRLGNPAARFVLVLGLTYLGASWVAGDSNLGYARNWDLLAPGGLVFACAGLALLLGGCGTAGLRSAFLAAALALSVFHTAGWIAVNASETRGVARVARLPLGGGRAATAVGTWYMRAGNDERALEWFRKALEEDPRNPNAHQMIGLVLVKQGRMEAAAEAFRRASSLRPDKPDYRNNLVEALVQLGRFEEALPHYAWLCDTEPENFHYWQRRVEILDHLGRGDEARRVLEQAREVFTRRQRLHPGDYGSNFDLGLVLLGLDLPAEALACFQRALHADPSSEAALYNVTAMLVRLGRAGEARPYIERLVNSSDSGIREQAAAWMRQIGG